MASLVESAQIALLGADQCSFLEYLICPNNVCTYLTVQKLKI